MADPGERDLALDQLRKVRAATRAPAPGKPPIPDHLVEKRPGIKVVARGKVLE